MEQEQKVGEVFKSFPSFQKGSESDFWKGFTQIDVEQKVVLGPRSKLVICSYRNNKTNKTFVALKKVLISVSYNEKGELTYGQYVKNAVTIPNESISEVIKVLSSFLNLKE